MQLRDYQQDLFDRIHTAIRGGTRDPIVVSPTGSGKTATFCYIAHRAAQAGNPVIILVHRRELITQTSATLKRFGVPHGIIQPGVTNDPAQHVQLGMVQTICRRTSKITIPKLIITDECHHAAAGSYRAILTAFPDAVSIGFTATPVRLDGKGLADYYGEIIIGQTVEWLIEHGHLVRPRYFAPPMQASLAGVKKRGGDYASNELANAMDKATVTGDAVTHYRRICPKSRAVAFCVNISHAQHVSEQFRSEGIPSGIIHGGLTPEQRRAVVDELSSGRIQVMTSVDVVSEGFDLPSAEVAILLRPTASLGLHLQQIGRILRPSQNKQAVVLDHVGNLLRHGFAEDEREWSLDGIDKSAKKSESLGMKQCKQCFCLHKPAPECPECGYVYPVPKAKKMTYLEANLEELTRKPIQLALKECKTRNDLKILAKARGYKPGFVYYKAKELGFH
jgi:DNA repair protein RadD